MFWKIGFLEAKVGEKKTSFSANIVFEDAMIFFSQKYSVTSHGFVILYICIIYNI